jgi:transposase-like protein
MAATKKTRTFHTTEFKAQVLDEVAKAATTAEVAARHGLKPNLLYTWIKDEKNIRIKAARQAAATSKLNGSNGHRLPASKPPELPAETKSKLQIIGLTPLIRELVIGELDAVIARELPLAIERALNVAFQRPVTSTAGKA